MKVLRRVITRGGRALVTDFLYFESENKGRPLLRQRYPLQCSDRWIIWMSLYGLYRDLFELRDIPDKGQCSSDSSADSVQTLFLTNNLVRAIRLLPRDFFCSRIFVASRSICSDNLTIIF